MFEIHYFMMKSIYLLYAYFFYRLAYPLLYWCFLYLLFFFCMITFTCISRWGNMCGFTSRERCWCNCMQWWNL